MRVFADTYFFIAALNPRDADHERALGYYGREDVEIVTTAWVLSEVAAAFAPRAQRARFTQLYAELSDDPAVVIVSADPNLFARGIELYTARTDKDWSLTDCISFVVMKDHQLTDALSGDHHFIQAGFTTLLG